VVLGVSRERRRQHQLAILADVGSHHQYFITTHSSDVLRSIKAATITQLEFDGQKTTRVQVSGSQVGDLKAGLMSIGIQLSDLHGCDRAIWVEGQTEEVVFPTLDSRVLSRCGVWHCGTSSTRDQ